MHYYIGIDIGTSAVKTVAFGPAGTVLASASHACLLQQSQPGTSEQDPAQILLAVKSGLNDVLSAMSPEPPRFIAFSAAMHSLILLDEQGQPLTPCITWADQRAGQLAHALKQTDAGKRFYALSGVPVHAMSPFCKCLWFREHMPAVFRKTTRIAGIKEFVLHHLCGQYFTDSSMAAATGFMNGSTLQWDAEILQYAGIVPAQLSPIVSADHTVASVSIVDIPSLPAGTPVYAGASDGACATVGSGILDSATMAVSIGTSGAARVLIRGFRPDPEMRTFCYHVAGDQYITGGATNNGAIVLDWLRENILADKQQFSSLLEEAASLPPGADGLLFLPYLQGERAPVWDADARAVFFGLTMRHRSAHLIRAAMEGVCFAVCSTGRILQEAYQIQQIHAAGGFTANKAWVQMLADFFNLPVHTGTTAEASARGAVMLADPHAFDPEANQTGAVYFPDPARHRIYQQVQSKATRLYQVLAAEMRDTDNG